MITQEELQHVLHYDHLTGIFTWKNPSKKSNKPKGSIAGCIGKCGYIQITINYKQYRGHNLAYLYMTGEYIQGIDHINGIRSDNRFSNLRICDQKGNSANAKIYSTNSTGIKGVTLDKKSKLYIAQVMADSIRYRRCFKTIEEASVWVAEIRKEAHGTFARHV